MQIFLISFFITLSFYSFGILFLKKLEFHNFLNKFSLCCVFGAILISFIALTLNFFFPLGKDTGNFFIIFSLVFFLVFFLKDINKIDIIKYSLLLSAIVTLLILYSNINRPDAGLYHLPYIQLINDNKILLGINNIHLRFAHISIIQYLSAIYNNSFFPIETILLPPAIIVSSIFLYFFSFQDSRFNYIELKIYVFLITIYSLYSFNRYSGFGNDATTHLLLFFLSIIFLQKNFDIKNVNNFGTISLISTYIFMQKTFMFFLPLFCFFLYLFLLIKKNIFKNLKILLSIIFLFLWILKNTLVSGCLVFPISITCIESLNYVDIEIIKNFEISGESWSKDWPNRIDKDIEMYLFNEKFNWFHSWYENHFQIIIKKLSLFIIPISIILIYSILSSKNFSRKINKEFLKKNLWIFFISFLLSLIWFLKFPIYRYGQSFLGIMLISIFSSLFIYFADLKRTNKILIFTTIFVALIAVSKNFLRIYEKNEIRNKWPNIYTLSEAKEENYKKELIPIYNNDIFIYYFSKNGECMYNKSPCSNYLIKNINKKIKRRYEIFYFDD